MIGWNWVKRLWSKSLPKRMGIQLSEHCCLVENGGGAPGHRERNSYVCCSIDPKQSALFVSYSKNTRLLVLRSSCCAGFRMGRSHGKRSSASSGTSVRLKLL